MMYRLLSIRLDDDDQYEACYGEVEMDDEDRFDYTVGKKLFKIVGLPGEPVSIPTEVDEMSDFEFLTGGIMPKVHKPKEIAQGKADYWGNSLAIRVPKALADQMGLQKGTKLTLAKMGSFLVISPWGISLEE